MALIRLDERNHEIREKSIKFKTLFGDVYAPKKCVEIHGDVALVPGWVFTRKGLNPCQMVTGYIG
jgi:hypothetical protein